MKQLFSVLLSGVIALVSCKKNMTGPGKSEEISQSVKDQIYASGFGTSNIIKVEEGYLVEGDIILTQDWLDNNPARQILRMANGEQYHTTNLVTGVPRTISLSLSSKLMTKQGFPESLQETANRFNAVPGFDGITFTIAAAGRGDINFVEGKFSTTTVLATSGFPNSRGEPYNTVKVNASAMNSYATPDWISFLGQLFSHEVGHCIGFRHTDWFDHSIGGCGSGNEGAGGAGAILIPGTPGMTNVDTGSWMLSCMSWPGHSFSSIDLIALDYLY
jgi:hypothetical protein